MNTLAIIVLSLPILVIMLAFDIIKIPIVVFLFMPIGLLTLIDMLRGEPTHFWQMIFEIATLGVSTWGDITGVWPW